jgi:hypothetical protein
MKKEREKRKKEKRRKIAMLSYNKGARERRIIKAAPLLPYLPHTYTS